MSGAYLDIEAKRLGYFAATVVVVAVLVTAIYWAVFGLNVWTTKVQQGANLMMAAGPVPYQGQASGPAAAAGQYVCPRDGAVGLPVMDAAGTARCPVCSQAMGFNGVETQGGSTAAPARTAAFGGG